MPRMNLQERWRQYRDTVYKDGVPAHQNRECHQAFMAGAFSILGTMMEISERPETPTQDTSDAEEIRQLFDEVCEWMRLRCLALDPNKKN